MVELARTHQKASWSFAGLLVIGGIGLLTDVADPARLADSSSAGGRRRHEPERSRRRNPRRRRRAGHRRGHGRPAATRTYQLSPDQSGPAPKLRLRDLSSPTSIAPAARPRRCATSPSTSPTSRARARSSSSSAPRAAASRRSSRPSPGCSPPTKGEVLVDGKPVNGVGRDRGMVFQAYTSFGWLTVRENVEYGLRLQGVPAAERREQADKYLEGGRPRRLRRPLPEGPLGRHEAARGHRAHAHQPAALVLMDEPFGALDPQTRWGMQGLLLDVSRSRGQHDPLRHPRRLRGGLPRRHRLRALGRARRGSSTASTCPSSRTATSRSSRRSEFRAVEKQLLDLLYAPPAGA